MNARERKHLLLRLDAITYDIDNLRSWIEMASVKPVLLREERG